VGFDTQSHSRRILYAHIVFIVGDEVSEKLGPISINRYEWCVWLWGSRYV